MSRRGYSGILNLEAQPHWTVFLFDFELPGAIVRQLERELVDAPTRILFQPIVDDVAVLRRKLRAAGVNLRKDYVSLHLLGSRYESINLIESLFDSLNRADFARYDLPWLEGGFQPSFASHLVKVVSEADYFEQDAIAERFFDLLGSRRPYSVRIESSDHELRINDDRGWFQFAGRLQEREFRPLPGGEVAYAGSEVSGSFVIDGAVLPAPQTPDLAPEASHLSSWSAEVQKHPMRLEISRGEVTGVRGEGQFAKVLSSLMEKDSRYRLVTEVGVSFNRACSNFIHDWPAASNESRPGVHLALGGDADRTDESIDHGPPLVHLDLVTANSAVVVNDRPFLRASS